MVLIENDMEQPSLEGWVREGWLGITGEFEGFDEFEGETHFRRVEKIRDEEELGDEGVKVDDELAIDEAVSAAASLGTYNI